MTIHSFGSKQQMLSSFARGFTIYGMLVAVAGTKAIEAQVVVLLALLAVLVRMRGGVARLLGSVHEASAHYQQVVGQQKPYEHQTSHYLKSKYLIWST
jgi:hypothetical protein